MRIAICDDQEPELERVAQLVEDYCHAHPARPLQTVPFHSGTELLAAVEAGSVFALYLLDVIMPDMTGIELADRLHAFRRKPHIAFLTTSTDYAIDAFRIRAKHYLLKPIQRESFFAMLNELLPAADSSADMAFTIPAAQGTDLTLPASTIVYAECVAHIVRYHLMDGNIVESRTLRIPFSETMAPLLSTGKFLMIHRSFAVNLEHVRRITERAVLLKNGVELPIARLRQREIRTAYIDFLSRTGWEEAARSATANCDPYL